MVLTWGQVIAIAGDEFGTVETYGRDPDARRACPHRRRAPPRPHRRPEVGAMDKDITIDPEAIIKELAEEFLKAPTAMLGDVAGETAGP